MSVSRAWKSSIIIPVLKKPSVKQMNELVASVADRRDPLRFAYKARKGVEDACLILVNLIALQAILISLGHMYV